MAFLRSPCLRRSLARRSGNYLWLAFAAPCTGANVLFFLNIRKNTQSSMNRKLVLFDDVISVLYDQEPASLPLPDISLGTKSERMIEVSLDHTQVSSSSTTEQSYSECPQGYLTSGNLASHHDLEKKISPAFRSSDYKLVSNIFIGLMMAQYILIFFAIPFSEVDNRPAASVLLCLLGYLLVCL